MQALIPYFPTIQLTLSMPEFMGGEWSFFHGFGLALGIDLIYGSIVTINRAERHSLDYRTFQELFFWLVFGIIIGGKIGFALFYYPQEHWENPALLLKLGSGLSSFGGFITCAITFFLVLRRRNKPILPYADNVIYGFSFGWMFGRLGCTLNHEHPGTASDFWLARFCRPVEGWTLELPDSLIAKPADLRFSHCIEEGKAAVTSFSDKVSVDYPGVTAVNDMGLYEMLYAVVLYTTLRILDRKPRPDGLYFLIMIYTYTPIRFTMDFLRPLEGNARYLGLTPAQSGCISFLTVTSLVIMRYHEHYNFKIKASPTWKFWMSF